MSNYSKHSRFYACLVFFEYITSKLIGLSPWTMDTSKIFRKNRVVNRPPTFKYKLSVVGSCYNILLIVSYILFDILYFYKNLNPVNRVVAFIIRIRLEFISIICMSIILLIFIIRQKSIVSVKNRFKDIDEKLNGCADYEMDHDNTNYWIFIANTVILCCWTILRIVFANLWEVTIAIALTKVTESILIVQYAIIIDMIEKRLKSINAALFKLGSSSYRAVLNDISSIKYAYVELCDMADKTADFYGVPTLIVIILSSLKNISNAYYIILIFLNKTEMESWMYVAVIFAVQTILLLTILTSSVTQVLTHNAETSRIINQLLDRFAINQEITKKLSKFSDDLWHMKFEFTLCDIVPLDRTFLAVISGTITTYLVIAVQFHFSNTD